MEFVMPWELISRAVDLIGNCCNKDASGVCILIIRAFIYGNSYAAQMLFTRLLTCADFMKSFLIEGSLFGRESSTTSPLKTRALLPLPAILTVADSIITCVLHDLVDRICQPPPGVFFGARRGTQVLDIFHAAHLHLQKGADNFNQAGLAQGDISAYFDSLDALKIARWMERHCSCDGIFWSSAFLRLQLLPKIRLTAGDSCTFLLDTRTIGALTGSRSAVAAGRVPVETTACKLAES